MAPSRQKSYFRYDKTRRQVRGVIYIQDKRTLHRLCSFDEARIIGIADDDSGNAKPVHESAGDKSWSDSFCMDRLLRKRKELYEGAQKAPLELKQSPSIKEVMQDWIDASKVTRAPRTLEWYILAANRWVEIIGEHSVTSLSLKQVDKFVTALAQRSLSPNTINIYLKTLKTFLNWAREREYIEKFPRIRLLSVDKQAPVTPKDRNICRLVAHLNRKLRNAPTPRWQRLYLLHKRFFMVALGTGARRAEIFYLPWEKIDLTGRKIAVQKSRPMRGEQPRFRVKEGRDKILYMPEFLFDYLKAEREAHPGEIWLLDNGHGEMAFTSPFSITHAMRRHERALGIHKDGLKPTHTFRAKWISDQFAAGTDLQTIMKGVGHRKLETTIGYLTDPGAHLEKAARVIDKKWGRKKLK